MNRNIKYLEKLKKPHQTAIKISWLHTDETVYQDFTNEFYNINGTISINYQDGARRTCTIVIDNKNNKFPINVQNIWYGQKFQVWTGLYLDDMGKDPYYISQGIYYIKNPKETYNPTTKTITLQGVDKWAFLDGSLFGYLTGTYKSVPSQDIRDMAGGLLRKNKYSNEILETKDKTKQIDPKPPIFQDFSETMHILTIQYVKDKGTVVFVNKKENEKLLTPEEEYKKKTLYTIITSETGAIEYYYVKPTAIDAENGMYEYAIENKISSSSKPTYQTSFTIFQSIFWQPYTIQTEVGKSFADIFLEYKTMLMGKVFYDRDGYMRFEPISTSVSDYSDENREIGWHFTVTEQEFMGLELENKFDSTYNDVVVLGAITNGKQAKARIQNRDPSSEFSIDRIGIKTKAPYNSDQYYSDEQCIALGKYYAQTDMAMEKTGTISSLPIYHLDVGQIITISTPNNNMSKEKFLVTSISHNLQGTMSITVTNIRYFSNWTAVILKQDDNGNPIAWVDAENPEIIIEEVKETL